MNPYEAKWLRHREGAVRPEGGRPWQGRALQAMQRLARQDRPSQVPKEEGALMSPETLGNIAFQAYTAAVGGRTHDDKAIPKWDDLTVTVRTGWEVAADAVALAARKSDKELWLCTAGHISSVARIPNADGVRRCYFCPEKVERL